MGAIFDNPIYLMMIMGCIIIAIGFGAWHFFGDTFRQLFRGTDKLSVLLIKKEPKLETYKLEIESDRYLVDAKKRRAWYLFGIQHKPSGEVANVVISNDSCIPQFPGMEIDLGRICESAKENDKYMCLNRNELAIEKVQREIQNSSLVNWLGVTALAAVLGVLITGCIILIKFQF